jgi:calcineurin-like phosphoesterase family protein
MAQTFTASLCSHGMRVFAIPGNHDQYTQQAYKNQTFYDYFDSRFSNEMSLKMDKISSCYLGNQWWLLGMDTALATSWISSSGCFSEQIECNLVKLLSAIPSDHHVVLMNHFPVFKPESPRNKLIRKDALKALLHKFHNIRFYLHGHTHRHSIADLRPNQLPIILDSGSVSHQKNGTWNMLEMGNNTCRVQGYQWSQSPRKTWTPTPEHVFKW